MILIADRDLIPLQTFLRSVVIRMDMNEFMRNPEDFNLYSDRSLRAAQTLVTVIPILVVYPFPAALLCQRHHARRPEGLTHADTVDSVRARVPRADAARL